MMHPNTELRFVSPEKGYGVFATRRIPRGTIVWMQDHLDTIFPAGAWLPYRGTELGDLIDRYAFRMPTGEMVLTWDHCRYVNHSCDPNCAGTEFGIEVALRDIEADEEITNDYATLCLEHDELFLCACGSPECRGAVGQVDADEVRSRLAEPLRLALELSEEIVQPLPALVVSRALGEQA